MRKRYNIMNQDVRITLAIITNGGAGNLFIQANFIYCLQKYLVNEPVKLIVFGHKSDELNELVFGQQDFTGQYFNNSESSNGYYYDVCVNLNFYPEVMWEASGVKEKSVRLHKLLCCWKDFMKSEPFREYCMIHPYCDVNAYIYGINNDKNCLNIADIGGMLGMKKSYDMYLRIEENSTYLHDLGLAAGQYITIQRGATPGSHLKESPKLWPVCHYEELIRLFKIVYPAIKIVQLGEAFNSDELEGIDINLLGKTSWKQLGIILKNAWLHIDGECGMVHFREVLHGGPSVVLFGATPMEFYAYEDNINIKSDACPHWCARLTNAWLEHCAKGYDIPPCMDAITPAIVISRIVGWDRLTQIKAGKKAEQLKFCNDALYKDKNIEIDKEYKRDYLDSRKIYYYEIKKAGLSRMKALVMTNEGFQYMSLLETPTYAMAMGNDKAYEIQVEKLRTYFYDRIHSKERFRELLLQLDTEGYSKERYIITDGDNRILDGQHRAVWLAARKGIQAEIEVLQIYCLTDDKWDFFPFEKIKRGSSIIIYGAGAVGDSYLKQLCYTSYCHVIALADRLPGNWNGIKTKRERIKCIKPEEIPKIGKKYDYIVLASRNDKHSADMRSALEKLGVDLSKVVSQCRLN